MYIPVSKRSTQSTGGRYIPVSKRPPKKEVVAVQNTEPSKPKLDSSINVKPLQMSPLNLGNKGSSLAFAPPKSMAFPVSTEEQSANLNKSLQRELIAPTPEATRIKGTTGQILNPIFNAIGADRNPAGPVIANILEAPERLVRSVLQGPELIIREISGKKKVQTPKEQYNNLDTYAEITQKSIDSGMDPLLAGVTAGLQFVTDVAVVYDGLVKAGEIPVQKVKPPKLSYSDLQEITSGRLTSGPKYEAYVQANTVGKNFIEELKAGGVTMGESRTKTVRDFIMEKIDEFKKPVIQPQGPTLKALSENTVPTTTNPPEIKTTPSVGQLTQPSEGIPVVSKLTPVEGTGETRVRGLSTGVKEKAVENSLLRGFSELPEYKMVNMADQAQKAEALLASEPDRARRIAMGIESPPEGIIPESVFVSVENRAIAEADVATLRDLATRSGLTTEATTMGQRIRTLAERNPESPTAAIQDIIKIREARVIKKAKTKTISKAKSNDINSLKAEIKAASPTKETWESFIKSIQC